MTRRPLLALLVVLLVVAPVAVSPAAATAPAVPQRPAAAGSAAAHAADKTIAEATEGMEHIDGFVPLWWDDATGKLRMEISRFDDELLYVSSLTGGVGSNDIGLDRNQLGSTHLAYFHRVGPRVLLIEPNTGFRAVSEDADERAAVEDAFARSVLWGFQVEAEENGRVLVDATSFFVRDAHQVANRLRMSNQGTFRFDGDRSVVNLERTRGFPKNTEVDVLVTLAGERSGGYLRSVTPTADSLTVYQHHSLVELPGPGYEPRIADPRVSFSGLEYLDYATPIGEPLRKRFVARHRLEKVDPAAEVSDPVEPIVYYLDRGTPEPIRSALLEGASWWDQAYAAAGYRDAFQVKMLPEGADPMDLRYNMINWTHRSTRGWSYGSSVTDPRTGEIIKGHVALGSLRVRQDYLIAEGLLSPYAGDNVPPEMKEMALARLRQLSAHEVGHTLGMAHNYVASTQGRASVMDYPHPLAVLDDSGEIDLSDAYAVGIGEWDKVAIAFGYQDFPDGTDEAVALDRILTEGIERGITFLSDQDARPPGSAHPRVHIWDNGVNAATELERMMEVRRVALSRMGENTIRPGQPLATIEEALVPTYLGHRYQVAAASKVVGGLYYDYVLRGDGREPLRAVAAEEQRRALDAVLATVHPSALVLPDALLDLIPPRPFRYRPHRELFPRHTGLVFDAVAPAEVAADLAVSFLLHPERAARLVQQNARDPELPGLAEVVDRVLSATFLVVPANGYEAEVGRAAERVTVDRLMALASDAPMSQVRAVATLKLQDLLGELSQWVDAADESDVAHYNLLAGDIQRFLERPAPTTPAPAAPGPPPGDPIGAGSTVPWLGCGYEQHR